MINYNDLFDSRVIIVSGVARSGTSILGKTLGCADNAIYFFEPVFLKICKIAKANSVFTQTLFFEDFVLQAARGYHVNVVKGSLSWWKELYSQTSIMEEVVGMGRGDTINALHQSPVRYVIKLTEGYMYKDYLEKVFPDMWFIEIIRNGNSVIGSSQAKTRIRGVGDPWYDDNYFKQDPFGWPWWVENLESFKTMTSIERAAHMWRVATCPQYTLKYEQLFNLDKSYWEKLYQKLGLDWSTLTDYSLKTIAFHGNQSSRYPDFTSQIREPERSKFLESMKKRGY